MTNRPAAPASPSASAAVPALPTAPAAAPASPTAPAAGERPQSLGEEIANSISHGLGLLGALVATPFLIVSAMRRGDAIDVAAAAVFSASMVLLYACSMLYHAMPATRIDPINQVARAARAKPVFQVLDHSAIYLLIAGTYTPFMVGALRGPWGWSILALVWALALAGIAAKALAGIRFPRLSTALYLGMGWLAVLVAKPMWERVPGWGLVWLLAGGLAYTAGVAFFSTDHRLRFGHFIWHLFVAAGTACHVVAVLLYAR
jgi:hemolysin III